MTEDNLFRDAGKRLRDQLTATIAIREQSLAALELLSKEVENGIAHFYEGLPNRPRVNNYATHIAIIFGERVDSSNNQYDGPVMLYIVDPDGTFRCASCATWHERSVRGRQFESENVASPKFTTETAKLLIRFLTETENNFKDVSAG